MHTFVFVCAGMCVNSCMCMYAYMSVHFCMGYTCVCSFFVCFHGHMHMHECTTIFVCMCIQTLFVHVSMFAYVRSHVCAHRNINMFCVATNMPGCVWFAFCEHCVCVCVYDMHMS